MRDAYRCLDAWGFKEKTILTWDKELLGLGDWLRNVTEHCILAVRGRPVVALTNQTTIIREKRREHSRKPVAFYDMVEALCPGSKLEMFSRSPRDGWGAWGAETEKFDAAQ
jgi:N6-adenosine-specific RNA methylase IME4